MNVTHTSMLSTVVSGVMSMSNRSVQSKDVKSSYVNFERCERRKKLPLPGNSETVPPDSSEVMMDHSVERF